jgi:hypothetical protein
MLAALPVVPVLVVVAGLAVLVRAMTPSPRVSTMAVFSVLASLVLAGFVALTRRRRPRAGVLAACHALVWSPFLATCAWQSIVEPIVNERTGGVRCGTGLMGLVLLALPVMTIFFIVVGVGGGTLFARPATDRVLRAGAAVATSLALIAFAFALVRIARPDPDTYLASLVPAGELKQGASTVIAGRALTYKKGQVHDPVAFRTLDGGDVMPGTVDCDLMGLDRPVSYSTDNGVCPAVRMHADAGHDLVVLLDQYGNREAFRPSTGKLVAVLPHTVADHIAPPLGWTLGAGFGGLFGAACVVLASRLRRRAAAIDGTPAKHVGSGLVQLPTGETLRVDAAAGLPLGDVVLRHSSDPLPAYRHTSAPTYAAASQGTLADMRGAVTDVAASLDALAIAAAVLGATPLVVARLAAGL